MEWQELLASMGRFGFAEREAKIYLLLLRRGRATARDLTRDSQMDRVLAYRTLDALRARGVVQVTAERPRRYVPIPPRVLFDRSLFERRTSLEEDVALAHRLSERLPEMTHVAMNGAPRFEVITGPAAIYPYLREMLRRAERQAMVMITPRGLRESAQFGLPQELPRLLRSGGAFRMIVERDPRVAGLIQRFLKARWGRPNAEVRGLDRQRARLTVVDDREAVLFLVPEAGARGMEEIAVWTDNRDFVGAQAAYFEAMWERAQPFRAARRAVPRSPRSGVRSARAARSV
jgi:sugar-specific transcriptional regulator TrmB